jgi:hypothetical protein
MSLLPPSSSATTKAGAGYATFDGAQPPPPAALTTHKTASWFSWLTFGYARAVMDKGSSQRRLELHDLWDLAPEFKTRTAYEAFKRAFLASGGTSVTRA